MPTYEYVCEKCDHRFDFFQSIRDEPLKTCPKEKCAIKKWGKGKVRRAIGGGAGLIFKGSGFYITDYRSESYKEGAKKESGGGEPKGAADAKPGGQNSKPAANKTETKPVKSTKSES